MKLITIFLFCAQYILEVSSAFVQSERQIGCDDGSQGDCTQSCRQGMADCTTTPPSCEFGYFLYPMNLGVYGEFDENHYFFDCVKCPYQDFKDDLRVFCMDCVENPYSWYLTRQCTYDYTIEDGNLQGVYTRSNRAYTELYHITQNLATQTTQTLLVNQAGADLERDLEKNQTEICEGCDFFCTSNLNLQDVSICKEGQSVYNSDVGYNYIVCLPGYFYNNSICQRCPDNCQTCSYTTSLLCLDCQDGYAYNPETQNCDACIIGCLNCYYGDLTFKDYSGSYQEFYKDDSKQKDFKLLLYCNSCDKSDDGSYRIPSLDQRTCEDCKDNCQRCEYVTYDVELVTWENWRYPTRYQYVDVKIIEKKDLYFKRCRQCIDPEYSMILFISNDGETCTSCDVSYCDYCYQYTINWDTTMQQDFTPTREPEDTWKYCYICSDGYTISNEYSDECELFDPNSNTYKKSQIPNCASYTYSSVDPDRPYLCSKCQEQFLLDLGGSYPICNERCTKYIDKCSYCYGYVDPDPPLGASRTIYKYFCLECQAGYYTNFFTGLCEPCNLDATDVSCMSCSQYSNTYNFTDYLITRPQLSSDFIGKLQQKSDAVLLPTQCNTCLDNYIYLPYVKKCGSCGLNCYGCSQRLEEIYCSECYTPFEKSLTSDKRQCRECPVNCLACRERTQSEIKLVNEDFNPTSDMYLSYSYLCFMMYDDPPQPSPYYDTTLGLPVSCSNMGKKQTGKCIKSMNTDVFIYCDGKTYKDTLDQDPTNDSIYNFNSYFTSKTQSQAIITFPKIENADNYIYLNEQVIQEMTININFIGAIDQLLGQSVCNFTQNTVIELTVQKNVFALKNLTVNINGVSGQSDQPVIFEMLGFLKFSQLRNVTLNNIRMISKYYTSTDDLNKLEYYGVKMQDNGLSQITLKNCIIGREYAYFNGAKIFQIYLNNVQKFLLKNVTLNSNYYEPLLHKLPFQYSFTQTSVNSLEAELDNVTFNKFVMSYQPLFQFNMILSSIQRVHFGPNGVILNGCLFYQSSFITEYSLINLNNVVIKIEKLVVLNSTFKESSHIIKLSTAKAIWLENIDIINTQFINNSMGFLQGSFQHVRNVYTQNVTISGGSSIFQSSDSSVNLKAWNFQNININITNCQSVNCIMKLVTPPNLNQNTNISIIGLQVTDLYVDPVGLTEEQVKSVDNAPIFISEMWDIQIYNYSSKNNKGITIMNLNQANSVLIDTAYLINEGTNLIPVTLECAQTKSKNRQTSKTQIYISKMMRGATINALQTKNLILMDTSVIAIESYTAKNINTTSLNMIEQYKFTFCTFLNNRIVLTEDNSQASLITINSEQKLNIVMYKGVFQQNHMHQLVTEQTVISSACILISSLNSNFLLESTIFIQNAASNTQYGLVYLQVYVVNYTESSFTDTNIYVQDSWQSRFETPQCDPINIDCSLNLSFFYIRSTGACSYISAFGVLIQNTQFQGSFGLNGGGLYLSMNGQGVLWIINTQFIYISSSLEYRFSTSGGCLYIDSTKSKLNFTAIGLVMVGCGARNSGGCIHIEPSLSFQNIFVQGGYFVNCFALKYSFLDAEFSDLSEEINKVTIKQIYLGSDQGLLHQFYYSLPQLSDQELSWIQSTSSVYFQRNGDFYLSDSSFQGIYYTTLFELQNMHNIVLTTVQISDVELHTRPLFIFDLANKNQQYLLSSIQISLVYEFEPDEYDDEYLQLYSQLTIDAFDPNASPTFQCDSQTENVVSFDELTYDDYQKLVGKYDFTQTQEEIIQPGPLYLSPLVDYSGSIEISPQDAYNARTIGLLNSIYTVVSDLTQTSIITITQVKGNQELQAKQISISNIYCPRCYNGLFQVKNVDNNDFNERVSIQDLLCSQNQCGYWGCLTISKISRFEMPNFGMDLDQRRVLSQLNVDSIGMHTVVISSSIFQQNNASVGAGLAVYGVSLLIYNSQFTSNYAKYAAGALYFNNTKDFKVTGNPAYDSNINITIYNSVFQSNQAQLYGAALLWDSSLSKEKEMQIVFSNNQGTIYGPNIQELANHLTIQMIPGNLLTIQNNPLYIADVNGDGFLDSNVGKIVDEVVVTPYHVQNFINETAKGENITLAHFLMLPSGQPISSYKFYNSETQEMVPYNYIFRIINLDRFYQQIGAREIDQCKVTARQQIVDFFDDSKPWLTNYTGSDNTFSYDSKSFSFNLDSLTIHFDPRQPKTNYLQLRFVCSSVELPIYSTLPPYGIQSTFNNYELWLNVQTFDCQLGEFYSEGQCIACTDTSNTYAVTKQATECTGIDQNSMIDVTPTQIKVRQGYWRSYDDIAQTEYCLNLANNCLGGWNPGDDSCYDGHIGALCESCDLLGSREGIAWATSGKCQCGKCNDILPTNVAIIIGISLFTLISMIVSVKSTKELVEQMLRDITLVSIGVLVKENKSQVGILIKILTNYFQIIGSIATFQLSLPGGFADTAETIGSPTKSMSVSYDCMFVDIAPNIPTLYFRMIWALAVPFFYLTVFLLVYCCTLLCGIKYKPIIVYTTFIYMFLYLQPTIIGGFIGIASSRYISGYSWVQSDVSVRADGSSHISWTLAFVLPNLLLWALFFPAGWLYMLYSKARQDSLDSRETRVRLGFFYNEYRISTYYWEFVKIFQKELITIFLIFYEDYVVVKGILVFVLVYGYSALTIRQKPYKSGLLNFLDFESASICSISMCLGVLMNQTQKIGLTYISIIVLFIILILNLIFILQMIVFLGQGYITQFQDKLDIIRIKIRKDKPGFGDRHPWLKPYLIVQSEMNERVKYLWRTFRFEVHQGIKRRRLDKSIPIIQYKISEPIYQVKVPKTPNGNIVKVHPEKQEIINDDEKLLQ